MDDETFRALEHVWGEWVWTFRQAAEPGYKPDAIVRDQLGVPQFILECENKTDRKAFLGDLVKAEKFSQQNGCTPGLIIVMTEFDNTTCAQIANHLEPYAQWLARMNDGALSLSRVQIMTADDYLSSIQARETLEHVEFRQRGRISYPAA